MCVVGEACGSPAAVIGKRRDMVEARERRKKGIISGWEGINEEGLAG